MNVLASWLYRRLGEFQGNGMILVVVAVNPVYYNLP